MSPHEFAIPVHDLDAAGKAFSLPIRVEWLRGAFEGTNVSPAGENGHVDIRLSKSGHDVVIRGRLRARLRVPCARCLEPADVTIDEELTALAVIAAPSGSGRHDDRGEGDDEQETSADEADTVAYDGETVVLDELVRDELLLAVPMIPLCSETCAGISHEAAAGAQPGDEPVDPRLKPLLKLKKT